MKILYVTTVSMTMRFFPAHIRMLQAQGHTVELACNMDEPPIDAVLALGCKIHPIPFSRSPLSGAHIRAYRELSRVLAAGHYDIVHTHTPIASALVRLACRRYRRAGLRVFYTAHGFHFFTGAPLENWLIYYPVEKLCARWTDVLLTITHEDYHRAARKLHAGRVVYVPGVGVDVKEADADYVPGTLRRELGIPETAKLILSVGELNENKNHITVLQALSALGRGDVYYVVCGEGDRRAALEEAVQELGLTGRVFLPGVRRDVPQWMEEADLYVHPSYREGLSVSTMEAMYHGLPVVCGDIRGNRDLIIDQCGGLLVNPAAADAFEKAIARLLADETLCRRMGDYNREAVRAFSTEKVLAVLRDIYGVNE